MANMTPQIPIFEVKNTIKSLIDKGASEQEVDKFISDTGYTLDEIREFSLDKTTGAPLMERLKIGLSPNLKSTEKTMKEMYPDAVADPKRPGNFIVTDPKTGEQKLFNPPGFDMGDIAQVGIRPVVQTIGNIYGSIKGAATGAIKGSRAGPYGAIAGGIAGAGTGEAVGGEAADRAFQLMGGEIDRSLKEYGTQRAYDFTIGSISEVLPPVLLKTIKAPFAGFTKAQKEKVKNNLKIFTEANTMGTMSMITQQPTKSISKMFETLLSNMPISNTVIGGAGDKIQKDLGEQVVNISNKLVDGPTQFNISPGTIIQSGVDNAIVKFKTKSNKLYDDALSIVSEKGADSTKVGINQFREVLDKVGAGKLVVRNKAGEIADVKPSKLQSKFLFDLRNEIIGQIQEKGFLTFKELREYRTLLGQRITNKNLIDDVATKDLKELYGALSEDLKVFLKDTDKKAYSKYIRADGYYKSGNKRINDVLSNVNKVDQERVFGYLLNRSQEGAKYISTIKKSLTADEFSIVQNRAIQQLGKMKAGQAGDIDSLDYTDYFSSENFLTNWNKLDSKAKDFLFSSSKYKNLKQDLDYIAKASEKIRESGKIYANPSGTASSIVGQLSITGAAVGGDLFGWWNVFQLGLFSTIGAKGLTDPKLVSWLANGTKLVDSGKADEFLKHLSKVGTVTIGQNPQTQQYILDVFNQGQEGEQE
jgi:hypothetical protein